MKTITIGRLDAIQQSARTFVQMMDYRTVFAFHGEMGAGKTTFIKAICRELGVQEPVSSPTFALINEYRNEETDRPVYHFDFYRLNNLAEAQDIGAEEYFLSGALCFIEWPERVQELLPPQATAHVYITENPDQTRIININ